MLYLKSCPKCHGDMFPEKDTYGAYRQCLQCGLIKDEVVKQPVLAQARKTAVA